MYSEVIPGERLGKVDPWKLDSFGAATLPTAAQVEDIYRQARQEGYAAGREESIEESRIEAETLRALLAGAARELNRFDEEAGNQVVELALEVAKQMLRQALAVQPELILAVVREAVGMMPQFSERARIVLNPGDASLVRSHLGAQLETTGWSIVEDATIERGGCRAETATAEVDSTLSARWRQIVARLGNTTDWLAG